jgi:predicted NAD/FAD-binding protein
MIFDVLRFNALAMKQLESYEEAAKEKRRGDQSADGYEEDDEDEEDELSIGDFIKREGLSDAFRDDYLLVSTESATPDRI